MIQEMSESFYDDIADIIMEGGIDEALLYIEKVTRCLPGQARFILNRALNDIEELYSHG